MKLTDLIPSSVAAAGFQGIEQQLRSRRYTSRWGLIVAVVSVVVQIALAYHLPWPPLPKSSSFEDLRLFLLSPAVALSCIAIVAVFICVLARYTGFLFRQSKEPFRYTFFIKEFSPIASTPSERFPVARPDQLKLLRYDLTERLNRRVRRFSLLEDPNAGGATQSSKGMNSRSHFHIEGDYAIRVDDEGWILHVWPRVRIGPASNPFTLAFPVRLLLEDDGEASGETAQGSTFEVEEYERLVERVYSSVATEVYKQIEIDLRDKMTLFPTGFLRALARYNEAEDFETSNTIDAYDRALEMYQGSLDELMASRWHAWSTRIGYRWPRLVSWEWTGIRTAMEAEARTKLGHSRCLIYRRLVSEMAGRDRKPIFKVRQELEEARELFRHCYNSLISNKETRIPPIQNSQNDSHPEAHAAGSKRAIASFAGPVRWRPRRKHSYQLIRAELCEAFAVSALAHLPSLLADSRNAQNFLQLAEALAINRDSNRVLLLLAKAELEPSLQQKLIYLNQAKESPPDSELVLYRLAYYSDLLARDSDAITPARANYLSRAYEAVLKVNPANIASLIGQGYLFWLVDDLDKARKKLRAGIELQKVVGQTFVGDLKYCLARVEVELAAAQLTKPELPEGQRTKAQRLLSQAVFDYEEATLADPAVAASYVDPQGNSRNTYYERINRQMLERYERFAFRTKELSTITADNGKTKPTLDDQLVSSTNTLLGFALNDYGNACLNYYLRFEVGSSQDAILEKAFDPFEQAVKLTPANFMADYNRFCALSWKNDNKHDEEATGIAERLVDKHAALFPAALATVLSRRAQKQSQEISGLSAEIDKLDAEIKLLKEELKTSQGNIDSQRQKERAKSAKTLPQKRLSLSETEQCLKQMKDKKEYLEKQLKELEKPVLGLLRETSLAPFTEDLSSSGIEQLLAKKDIDWSVFGDREVSALVALARVWDSPSAAPQASKRLYEHIVQSYYPENFDVIWALAPVTTEPGERQWLNSVIDKSIDWSLSYDMQSRLYKLYRLARCNQSVSSCCNNWPYQFSEESPYQQAIDLYQGAERHCSDFPDFHYSRAFAYQYRAKQLAGNDDGRDRAIENSKLVLQERREACRLDPRNQEYRDNLLATVGRQLIAGNTFEDPLEQRIVPNLIELEFASESIPDLGFPATGLSAGLQQRITDVRKNLQTGAGFTLPGIRFRDNAAFERGDFRVLIRGVPLPVERIDPKALQSEQWDELTRCIKEAALSNAARFYTSQDCYVKLREIAKTEDMNTDDIQNDLEMLCALTWVLKVLLREQVPISDFGSIVSEFRRCRSLNRGLVNTVEEIRSLPQIRKRLPGNSHDAPPVISGLNPDLENRIAAAIIWNGSEPCFNGSSAIRQEVRSLALQARIEAGRRCAVLLTTPVVRPFARNMLEGMDVSVLSRREILPTLLLQMKDSDAARRTQLRAEAGG